MQQELISGEQLVTWMTGHRLPFVLILHLNKIWEYKAVPQVSVTSAFLYNVCHVNWKWESEAR